MFDGDTEYVDVEPDFFNQPQDNSDLVDVPENFFEENNSGDFVTGVKRGANQVQAMGFGATALAGSAIGSDRLKNWGMEGYQRNIEEAGQYPKKHSFKDVYTGEAGVGGTIDWVQGTFGELLPSMAEAAVGAFIGSMAAPGPGTATGAFAGRTVLKKSIDKITKTVVEDQIKKGVLEAGSKELVEAQIKKQVTSQALKKLGGKAGMGAAVLPLESGGNYAQLLEEKGIDAPGTALFFGALSTSLEYAGGNSQLIDTFIDAVGAGSGSLIKRSAQNLITNIPQEALQEGGQEVFSILNTVVNTDEKFLTGENIDQIIESMGAGAVGGMGGATLQTAMPGRKTNEPQSLLDEEVTLHGDDESQKTDQLLQTAMSTGPTNEYSDTIPFAGVPNEQEIGWMEEIERQRNPQPEIEPGPGPLNPVQQRYQDNQEQMERMVKPPDYSAKDSQDLLDKNIDEFRRVRSQEASVDALERRQQAMRQPSAYKRPTEQAASQALQGFESRAETHLPPSDQDVSIIEGGRSEFVPVPGIEKDNAVTYNPFADIVERLGGKEKLLGSESEENNSDIQIETALSGPKLPGTSRATEPFVSNIQKESDAAGEYFDAVLPSEEEQGWINDINNQRNQEVPKEVPTSEAPKPETYQEKNQKLIDAEYTEDEPVSKKTADVPSVQTETAPSEKEAGPAPKKGVQGRKSKTYLNDNTPVHFKYEVIDASELITSHNENMEINPDFPAELQPRERSRKASLLQVESIASKLNPERLGSSSSAAQGAPIIGDTSNVVESGNGRVLAIKKAYAGKTGLQYKKWVNQNAEKYGISPSESRKIKLPILVRRRTEKIDDLSRFTQQANEADTAKLSSTEQAIVDANNLSKEDLAVFRPSEDGDLSASSNKAFIDRFIAKMTPEEQSGYLTGDGRANKQLIDRVQAAIFQKAYNADELLVLTAEEADPDIKNILNGLNTASVEFAKARGLDEQITSEVVQDLIDGILFLKKAQKEYPKLKSAKGGTKAQAQVNQKIAQQDVFGEKETEESQHIAQILSMNIRSGKRIGEFISHMGSLLRESIVDLNQIQMFDNIEEITSPALIDKALKRIEDRYEDRQESLFGRKDEHQSEKPVETDARKRGSEKSESGRDTRRTSPEDTGEVSPPKKSSPPHVNKTKSIEDFGEKIGDARKDLEKKSGPKIRNSKQKETGWKARFQVKQVENETVKIGQEWKDSPNNGKWGIYDKRAKTGRFSTIPRPLGNKFFDTQEEAEEMRSVFAVAVNHSIYTTRKDNNEIGYTIFRSVGKRKRVQAVPEIFDSREAAMKHMVKNAEKLLSQKLSFGEEILPKPETVYRKGQPRREGDVSAEDFSKTFGFRGVEFGNWVSKTEERQEVMNHAYDSLLDMADIVGIPPEAVSLNGDLALAFGARGQGLSGAAAHYEPLRSVINLTKMSGAGHLAHEWFHAFDHYVARLDSKTKASMTEDEKGTKFFDINPSNKRMVYASHGFSYNSKARKKVREAFSDFVKTMFRKAKKYVEDTKKAESFLSKSRDELKSVLDGIRTGLSKELDRKYYKRKFAPATQAQLNRWDQLTNKLLDGEHLELEWGQSAAQKRRKSWSGYYTNDVLNEMSEIYKAVRGRTGFAKNGDNSIGKITQHINIYRSRIEMLQDAKKGEEKTSYVPTEFRMQATAADQARSQGYWSSEHEMAARAFAAYIEDRLKDKDAISDFLAYHAHGALVVPIYPEGLFRPYPEGKERDAINKAFDKLFSVLKTKKTKKGVALYQTQNLNQPSKPAKLKGKEKLKAIAKAKKDKRDGRDLAKKRVAPEHSKQDSKTIRKTDAERHFHNLFGRLDKSGETRLTQTETKEHRQLKKIAAVFGKQLYFWETKHPELKNAGGFTDPASGNEIFINANAKDPLISIVGHELIHQLKHNHSDLYEFLENTIRTSDSGFKEYVEAFHKSRQNDFSKVKNPEKVYEEFIGDFASDQFHRVEFWSKLAGQNRSFTQKIVDVLQSILDKIKRLFPRAEQYVTNFQESQDALAYAMSEGIRREKGLKPNSKSGTKFQVTSKKGKGDISTESNPDMPDGGIKKQLITDDNGNPLVLYHGTQNGGFESFDTSLLGTATKAKSAEEGFFFSDSKHTAKAYQMMTISDIVPEKYIEEDDFFGALLKDNAPKKYADRVDKMNEAVVLGREGIDKAKTEIFQQQEGFLTVYNVSKMEAFLKEHDPDILKEVGNLQDDTYEVLEGTGVASSNQKLFKAIEKRLARPLLIDGIRFLQLYVDEIASQKAAISVLKAFGKNPEVKKVYLRANKPYKVDYKGRAISEYNPITDHIKHAKKHGYDSVILKNIDDGGPVSNHYVVFDPTQIESITSPRQPSTPDNGVQNSPLFQMQRDTEAFNIEDNSTFIEDFKYNVVDMLSPVSKIYKAIGKDIPEHADFRLKEQLRVSKAKGDIDASEAKYAEPIKKIIGESGMTVEDVDEFLYARHAPEANARLRLTNARYYLLELAKAQKGGKLRKEVDALDKQLETMDFPTKAIQGAYSVLLEKELKKAKAKKELSVKDDWERFKNKPSGMTDTEAAEIMDRVGDNSGLKKIAEIFDRMNNASLDTSLKAGRMSQDEYDSIKNTFNYYAPLHREGFEKKRAFKGIGSGVKNLGTDVKTRGGSTKRAVHLLANAIVNHEKAIINAKKAEVAKAFLEFVKMNPNKDFWDFEEPKTRAVYDAHGNITRQPAQSIEENEVNVKVDGETYIISANPNNVHAMRILDIIKGANVSSGPIVGALSRINRLLAAVNTTYNPEFIISNFTRDIQTAAYNLNDTDISKLKKKVFKSIPKAMAGLHSLARGDGSHEWAKIAKRYEKSGAKIGWIDYGRDIESKAKNLEGQVDLFREGYIAKKTAAKLVKWVEDYNSIVENAVRLSTFKTGIDSGMSSEKAAIMAKNLTVNFNQKGAYGPVINSLYLFANAGIQGSTRIITALKNSKGARKMVGGSILAATGLAIANSNFGGEDEDGIPYYDQIDEHLKARNMIFMIPGSKGDFVKIPLPWGYNVFWAIGTEMGDAFTKPNYKPLEGMSRLLSITLDAFNPLQSATILQTISPTIADPFVQVGENKTFFGAPLMPEGNPFAKYETPDSEKHWSSAREPSKFVAKQINNLTGGDALKSGWIDVSPETLDLVFDTMTGGAGRFLMDTLSLPLDAVDGDAKISKAPFARKILGSKSEYKTTTDYRKNIGHVYQLVDRIKTYPEKAKELKRDKTYTLVLQAKKTESRLRKLKKFLKAAKKKNNQEAVAKIEKRIEMYKKDFNKKFIALDK